MPVLFGWARLRIPSSRFPTRFKGLGPLTTRCQSSHDSCFPIRPWYTKKEEPSFADMLTTLRRVSYEEKTPQPLPKQTDLKTWIAQLTELLSRTG